MIFHQMAYGSIMQPTHDTSTGLEQHYKKRNVTVPTFPYTETPILPPDLYESGMTSKEGLQEVPNVDPLWWLKPHDCIEHILSDWERTRGYVLHGSYEMDNGQKLKTVLIHSSVTLVLTYGPNARCFNFIPYPQQHPRSFLTIHASSSPLLISSIQTPLSIRNSSTHSPNRRLLWPMRSFALFMGGGMWER